MKRSKTHTLVSRFIILFFVVVVAAWVGWLWWADSISPMDTHDTTPIDFIVHQGDGTKIIAANLATQNLIHSPTGFYLLVKLLGIEKQLQAGDFRLNKSMDARTMAMELTHGMQDIWITTLEGWRDEEIAAKVAKDMDIPEEEFMKYVKVGYMFPDTYSIPKDATAAAIAQLFLDNFDKKVTPQMRRDAGKLNITLDQVITLASLVEREGRTDSDRPVIAGILYKRWKNNWPLEVDATLQYALGYQPVSKTWWKKELTDQDKKIDSPYNTYLNPGLPPTPIANPGLASIQAVIYMQNTDYWYYIHDPSGNVHYAKTLPEHNANITKYLQ